MELLLCVCGCVCVRVCVCACVSVYVCWLVYMSMTALTESFVLAMCTPCNVMGVLYSSVGAKVEILAAETPELSFISQGPFLQVWSSITFTLPQLCARPTARNSSTLACVV